MCNNRMLLNCCYCWAEINMQTISAEALPDLTAAHPLQEVCSNSTRLIRDVSAHNESHWALHCQTSACHVSCWRIFHISVCNGQPQELTLSTSVPRLMPPSMRRGTLLPTARLTEATISSGAGLWSNCRPPWFDSTMPSTPASTALLASLGLSTPCKVHNSSSCGGNNTQRDRAVFQLPSSMIGQHNAVNSAPSITEAQYSL